MSAPQWFDGIARVAGDVAAIKAVHAGGKGGQGNIVQPMIDQLGDTPAAILGHDGLDILTATHQRQTHNLLLSIWIERSLLAEGYQLLVDLLDAVPVAYEAHAKGYLADPNLQSVVVMGCDPWVARAWPPGSNSWYLVMPWRLQAKVNRSVTYSPA